MKLNKNKDYIGSFVDKLKSLVGGVFKGDVLIYLKNNEYIIDHDYNGYDLGGNNIVITDEKIINIKKNHPFFKKDVIYYTDKRGRHIDIYYDAITKHLIGYKELSRDYIDVKNTTKKIRIKQSIYNKIKTLGYSSEYIDSDKYDIDNKQERYNYLLRDVCSNRLENLKRTIIEFQRVFNKILTGINIPKAKKLDRNEEDKNYFSNKLNVIINKYKFKFNNIQLTNKKGNGKIFKHWKGITRGLFIDDVKDSYISNESKHINVVDINRYDETSDILLYYIIKQLTNLLDYNESNFIKINIANFIIEFFDVIYNRYNNDYLYLDNDINRFVYSLKAIGYLKEIYDTPNNNGIYEEHTDTDIELTDAEIEHNIDIKESLDAIDVDMSFEDIEENGLDNYDRLMERY